MKKFLFFILFVVSFMGAEQVKAQAQTFDSSTVAIRFGLQARDWRWSVALMNNEVFDRVRDSLMRRFRSSPPALGTTVVTVDSVEIAEVLTLWTIIRMQPIGTNFSYARVDAAVRALTNPYVVRRVQAVDDATLAEVTDRVTMGNRRLMGDRKRVMQLPNPGGQPAPNPVILAPGGGGPVTPNKSTTPPRKQFPLKRKG